MWQHARQPARCPACSCQHKLRKCCHSFCKRRHRLCGRARIDVSTVKEDWQRAREKSTFTTQAYTRNSDFLITTQSKWYYPWLPPRYVTNKRENRANGWQSTTSTQGSKGHTSSPTPTPTPLGAQVAARPSTGKVPRLQLPAQAAPRRKCFCYCRFFFPFL
ncbi:hypothetical protein O6H91_17G086200 [Diphasiastrum complanatum]|uniref:Uncharacterized protein n=1 Tax=Diphasiastrum complanatum TaxID=34168 RepID=A0ACC2B9P2_DIPCM|nr:hypothetical protein O6H91_17G086200 [Diphasiastrum complanatum]